jgi:arylsulfatase A-like enzyme
VRAAPVLLAASLAACGGGGSGPGPAPTPTAAPTPSRAPNVVLILADDLGWGDLAVQGGSLPTPRLDALAASGARLTSFYVASPVCSPSRAALLTGRWPARTGVTWVQEPPQPLRPEETTLAEALKDRGYATAMFGKWHLGAAPWEMPTRHGFDTYWGLPHDTATQFFDNETPFERLGLEQLSALYLERARAFIRANASRPFFLALTHRLTHLPSWPDPQFAGRSGVGLYGDTLLELDWYVGQVVDEIAAAGLTQDTIIVFASDNGPVGEGEGGGSAGPFTGRKQGVGEAGIRVPAIVSWPGRVPARVIDEPLSTVDLFPTLVAMAGGTPPSGGTLDGEDIGPLLRGTADRLPDRGLVFWIYSAPAAVREGKWKYVRDPVGLYDLSVDPGEGTDLARQNPDVVARLEGRAQAAEQSLR